MKEKVKFLCLCFLCILLNSSSVATEIDHLKQRQLKDVYEHYCQEWSDTREHIPVLRQLATECSSVVEIGIRSMVSTWGLLQGLSENPSRTRSYLGIDLVSPPLETLNSAKRLAEANGISFRFVEANDMQIKLAPAELLFIDSLHTYCHLTYELEKFSPMISKYIVMHDTSEPWGYADDSEYRGNYSEYPPQFDRNKRGLWPAVEDFLKRHPEWKLYERRLNSYGLTILQRISN